MAWGFPEHIMYIRSGNFFSFPFLLFFLFEMWLGGTSLKSLSYLDRTRPTQHILYIFCDNKVVYPLILFVMGNFQGCLNLLMVNLLFSLVCYCAQSQCTSK